MVITNKIAIIPLKLTPRIVELSLFAAAVGGVETTTGATGNGGIAGGAGTAGTTAGVTSVDLISSLILFYYT